MWSNWQRPERDMCSANGSDSSRAVVKQRRNTVGACTMRSEVSVCDWLHVYDGDCALGTFIFCRYSTLCDQWNYAAFQAAFTFFTTLAENGYHMKVCTYVCLHTFLFVTAYSTIWSCNLTAIIVKLQNNELNCLYFFTCHTVHSMHNNCPHTKIV